MKKLFGYWAPTSESRMGALLLWEYAAWPAGRAAQRVARSRRRGPDAGPRDKTTTLENGHILQGHTSRPYF
eukprot:gene24615-biopygen8954